MSGWTGEIVKGKAQRFRGVPIIRTDSRVGDDCVVLSILDEGHGDTCTRLVGKVKLGAQLGY